MPSLNRLALRIGAYVTLGVVALCVLLQTAHEIRANRDRDGRSILDRAEIHAELASARRERLDLIRRVEAIESRLSTLGEGKSE